MGNSWSGLRKKLENEFLCSKLRGRVQYFCTHYHNAHDGYGRIAIRVDGKERILGNPFIYYNKGYHSMELEIREQNQTPSVKMASNMLLYDIENRKVENIIKESAMSNGDFKIYYITDAIRIYTQSPIDMCLEHEDYFVRLFAILDYRVGKRTLNKMVNTIEQQPEWLQFFYKLRFDAENIKYSIE